MTRIANWEMWVKTYVLSCYFVFQLHGSYAYDANYYPVSIRLRGKLRCTELNLVRVNVHGSSVC